MISFTLITLTFTLCVICPNALAFHQVFHISETAPYNNYDSNGLILTKGQEDIDQILNTTVGLGFRGIWQVYDGETGFGGYSLHYTTGDDLGNSTFTSRAQHLKAVRPLGSLELTDVALSLYEDPITAYPFGPERRFTERAWSGEPFKVMTFVTTGWSNWTLYEGSSFNGSSYCVRSDQLYTFGLNFFIGPLPSVVGSILRGCDSKNIDFEINLTNPGEYGLATV